jgi:hypothetical protein
MDGGVLSGVLWWCTHAEEDKLEDSCACSRCTTMMAFSTLFTAKFSRTPKGHS